MDARLKPCSGVKTSAPVMQPEDLCSQQRALEPYPTRDESSSKTLILSIKHITKLSPIYAKVLQLATLPSCLPPRGYVCTILRNTPIRLHHCWTDVYKVFADLVWIFMSSRRSFLHFFCFDGIWPTWYLTLFHRHRFMSWTTFLSLVWSNPVHFLFILCTCHVMEHPVVAIIHNKFS
jgi:hypothetical protein